MELAVWADFAEIVGALAVVGGVAYGVLEWRELQRKRVDLGAQQIVHSFQSQAWIDALRIVWRLSDDAAPRDVSADVETERAALTVATYCHTLGYMVHRGTMPLEVMAQFQTGTVNVCWKKLRRWTKAIEKRSGEPCFRWFEWLAEQVAAQPDAVPVPVAAP